MDYVGAECGKSGSCSAECGNCGVCGKRGVVSKKGINCSTMKGVIT